jgi:putative ABC transport system permease protein
MAAGATFGALDTMYSAVAARGQEIATPRAIGFGGRPASVMVESLVLALAGLLAGGTGYALAKGFLGGIFPALRAVRTPIAVGLRQGWLPETAATR